MATERGCRHPGRDAVIKGWLDAVLKEGRKANLVTAHWRRENRAVPEETYVAWVRELKRRLQSGLPEWLAARLRAAWSDRADELIAALALEPPLFVRANTCRTTPGGLAAELEREGIAASPMAGACLRLAEAGRGRIFRSKPFQNGLCEVQDAHSQQLVTLLQPRPGEAVIDACAGEGGKALQMADFMGNRGRLRAFDPQEHKLQQLRRRARRAGYHNIEARPTPQGPAARRLRGSADAVLVDAPCSATGIIRRHPEIMWKLTTEQVSELAALQASILGRCAYWAKPGGRILYATCSLLPDEGEAVVRAFLQQHGAAFTLAEERRWWPAAEAGDGFYAALLLRKPEQLARHCDGSRDNSPP